MHCKSCGKVYPSPDYPMTHEVSVKSPSGDEHLYRYYQDAKGRQYFFEARVWYARIHYYDGVAHRLAQVYDATKDERYARAAGVLLDQYRGSCRATRRSSTTRFGPSSSSAQR